MPELAAPLERELRRKLGASFRKVVDNETRMQIEQCLMPVVAAALAACAREANERAAQCAESQKLGTGPVGVAYAIRALERAAGEKG